jgi:hypothetical protein
MALIPKDDLYIPPRSQRSVGLGGAVLRALAVMAVLDVALMLVVIDREPQPIPAVAREVPASPIDAAAEPPVLEPILSTAAEPSAKTPPAIPADAIPAEQLASTSAARDNPEHAASAPALAPTASALPPEKPVEPAPTALVPLLPQPIPAVATLPSSPAIEPPSALEPAVVLPSAKPRPPAAAHLRKPIRRAGTHAQHQEPPARPDNLVQAAAPQGIEPRREPPPCKPYTAETTLAGEARSVRGIACPDPNGGWRILTERASLD